MYKLTNIQYDVCLLYTNPRVRRLIRLLLEGAGDMILVRILLCWCHSKTTNNMALDHSLFR